MILKYEKLGGAALWGLCASARALVGARLPKQRPGVAGKEGEHRERQQ
jgi:hypothetical protein